MSAIAVSRGNRHAVCHFDAAIAISPEMLPPVDAVEKPSPNLPTYAPVIRAVGQITTPPPSPPRFADLYGSPQNHSESPSNPDFPQDSSASDISSLSRKSDFPRAPHPAVSPLAPHQPDSPHVAPAACAEPVRGALSRRDLRRHRRVASSPQPGPSEPGEGSYAETQRLVTSEIDGRSIVRPRHNRRSSAGGASGGSTETGSRENGRHCGDLYGRQEAVRLVSAGQPTAAVSAFSPKSPSFVSLSRKSPLPKSPSPQPPPRGSPPRRLSHSSDAIPLQRGGCSAEIPLQRGRRSAEFPLQSERVPRKSSSAEISSPRVFPAELPPPPSPRGFPSELPPSPSTTPREGASRAPPRSPAVGRLAAARAWNKMMAMPPLSTDLSAPPAELLSSSPRGVTTTASTTSGRTRSTFLPLYPEVDAPRHSSAELSPHGATITTPHQRASANRSSRYSRPRYSRLPPAPRTRVVLLLSPHLRRRNLRVPLFPAVYFPAFPIPAFSPFRRLCLRSPRVRRAFARETRPRGKPVTEGTISSGNGSTNSGCSSPCPSNPGSYLERISAGGKSLKPSDFVLKMPYEDIKARYSLGKKEIGEGRFGSIRTCLERSSGNFYACKTISKKIIETPEEAEDVRREVMFLATLKGHPYIVTLKEALEDKSAIHLIMELCPGGDLFERIKSRAQLTEPEAASILRQLLVALIHSHSLGILHRDVKPENILLCSPASCSSIKLIDFGVATVLPEGAQCNEAAGTPEYMAPEVYDEKYGFGADVWGAGVSLYVMLSGIPPFWESTNRSLEQAIRNKKLSFKHWKWADVSVEAKELISRMLEKDPSKRITAQEALAHPWITKLAPTAA
ncbi:unnamed protein product [Closterium sp. Yama58-4]|nr:unnamed protein product [Closterium sp. Yama58-4]